MIIDFLDILIRKKLSVNELNNGNQSNGNAAGDVLIRTISLNTIPEVTGSPVHTIKEEDISDPYY